MMKKVTFLAAVGLGYVLGARAGRGRYEQIKHQANQVWHDPRVQQAAADAQDYAAAQAPVVKEKAASVAKEAAAGAQAAASAVADKVSRSDADDIADDVVDTAKDTATSVAETIEDEVTDAKHRNDSRTGPPAP